MSIFILNREFSINLFLIFQDSIVTQLFNRFMQGQIYTYIGDILLAVNPFTQLGIYNDEVCYCYYYSSSRCLV